MVGLFSPTPDLAGELICSALIRPDSIVSGHRSTGSHAGRKYRHRCFVSNSRSQAELTTRRSCECRSTSARRDSGSPAWGTSSGAESVHRRAAPRHDCLLRVVGCSCAHAPGRVPQESPKCVTAAKRATRCGNQENIKTVGHKQLQQQNQRADYSCLDGFWVENMKLDTLPIGQQWLGLERLSSSLFDRM